MSYQTQYDLAADGPYQSRTIACCTEQANVYKDDARPSFVATATGILRADAELSNAFIRIGAAGPGIADKVDNGDGTIDSIKLTDGDLLSLTQANWQVVAGLYFNEDGSPKE
jgi:hypothetical protein